MQVVPQTVADATVAATVAANGEPRMVAALALPSDQLLVATSATPLPQLPTHDDLRQALLLTMGNSQVVDASGARPAQDEQDVTRLVGLASAAAHGGNGTILGDPVNRTTGGGREQVVAAYAPVSADGLTGALGLTVVSVTHVQVAQGTEGGQGLIPAAGLAVVALLGFVGIRTALIRPLRRLRADALAVASGRLTATLHRHRPAEIHRISAALEHCRNTLLNGDNGGGKGDNSRRRRGPSCGLIAALSAAAVLGWSAAVLLTVGTGGVEVPPAVTTSIRNQTVGATEALRKSMNDGLADLAAVAALAPTDSQNPSALRPAIDRLVKEQSRYRSVYVVDNTGEVTMNAGRAPLRSKERPPAEAGVQQQNDSGRVAVLYAHTPLAGGFSLVGEFDLNHLAGLLGHAPGKVRLLDTKRRTIAATDGYVAFEDLSDDGLRTLADKAGKGDPAAEVQPDSGGRVAVASALRGGPSGKLGWTVVVEEPIADLALTDNELRHNAVTVAMIGGLLAALLFGWHHFVLIRPLRRVAATADRIVAGDHAAVLYPQHHDEIGTVASCLEICRQALTMGPERLGSVRRPPGAATDVTQLIRRVPVEPARRPLPRHAPSVGTRQAPA